MHHEIAWDIVLRHLRSFTGQVLLFAFPDSDVYDAATAEISYSKHVRQFDPSRVQFERLTAAQRQRIHEESAFDEQAEDGDVGGVRGLRRGRCRGFHTQQPDSRTHAVTCLP